MIKNIIFDFGDIFINLDKEATITAMKPFGFTPLTSATSSLYFSYEKGEISSKDFIAENKKRFPKATELQLITAWNAIILNFPEDRLTFIEQLAKDNTYNLILLSNTNALHIEQVIKNMGVDRYLRFKSCFSKFYLSHEIGYRKPDLDIYNFVLSDNNINPKNTLFIDDTKENTDAAKKLGINTWNLTPGVDDICNLFQLAIFRK